MANRRVVQIDAALMPTRYRGQPTRTERGIALLLSAAMVLLFGLVIVWMGYFDKQITKVRESFTAITMSPASSSSAAKKQAAEKQQKARVQPTITDRVVPPVVPPKIAIATAPPIAAPMITLSGDDFAASDISKLGKSGAGSGNSKGTMGPGEGPQGQRLYRAEWHREPSRAELAGYMTEQSVGGKWAEIACRTIENYRVDNCQMLGESPAGSGLARALRQAAWQFQVRPPRIDGKPQVGAWVKIHFDFVRGQAN